MAQEIKTIEEEKKRLDDLKDEIKSISQAGRVQTLKDEAKALKTKLVSKGAIPKKGKKEKPSQEDDGRGIPDQVDGQDGDDDDDQDDEVSEVQAKLVDALAALKACSGF